MKVVGSLPWILEIQDRILLNVKGYTGKFSKENEKLPDAKGGNESTRARIQNKSGENGSAHRDLG
jgi:hypothetical protein